MRSATAFSKSGQQVGRENRDELLDALIRLAESRPTTDAEPAKPHHPSREVLLEVEHQGARFQLVRTPLDSRSRLLSPREREIARMVAKGYPNKTIAGVLEVSTWTVGTHLRRIFLKLGVGSRAAMVAKLVDTGILQPAAES